MNSELIPHNLRIIRGAAVSLFLVAGGFNVKNKPRLCYLCPMPCVVGPVVGTSLFKDFMRLKVDCSNGIVRIDSRI